MNAPFHVATARVFGAINNLRTGEEYGWDGAPLSQALADCTKIQSPRTYGKDWEYAGDCGLDEGDIFVDWGIASTLAQNSFAGKTALRDFLKAYRVTLIELKATQALQAIIPDITADDFSNWYSSASGCTVSDAMEFLLSFFFDGEESGTYMGDKAFYQVLGITAADYRILSAAYF